MAAPRGDPRMVEATKDKSHYKLGVAIDLPRDDFEAWASCLLQQRPVAAGWVHTGAWCDGHAMCTTRLIRTRRGGYQGIPENSWRNHKRRTPVSQSPKGGVVLFSNNYEQAA